jgi:hypothetical protein
MVWAGRRPRMHCRSNNDRATELQPTPDTGVDVIDIHQSGLPFGAVVGKARPPCVALQRLHSGLRRSNVGSLRPGDEAQECARRC